MKELPDVTLQLITDAYNKYRLPILHYVYRKLGNREEAEDMTQETFLRLLDYSRIVRRDTVKCFVYTIARNLVTDYLRCYYRKQEMQAFLMEEGAGNRYDVESTVIATDLQGLELRRMETLPPCRKLVYRMSRFEDKTADDIALTLNISKRTAERHLLLGRKDIREYIRQCI